MNIINQNITKYRTRAGLSQSDLARLLNVSPQAISRWERTGTPDTMAIPKIAAVLGCTPNDLYGISGEGSTETEEALRQDLQRTPMEQRFKRANALAWHIMKLAMSMENGASSSTFDFLTSCEGGKLQENEDSLTPHVTDSSFSTENGIMMASIASEFKYVLIMPEPEEGYTSIMKSVESYQALFSLLARPYRLQVFLMGYSIPWGQRFTRDYVCAHLNISPDVAQEVLDDLYEHHMLENAIIHIENDHINSYRAHTGVALIPYLCFGRHLMYEGKVRSANATTRTSPLIKTPLHSNADNTARDGEHWTPANYDEDATPSTSFTI
ncbi:MAG: helix-turn-helix transcriptional regulator [Oscillospiraceae bacterium]|nr:helix-turn-helix transcriptional regulator [Oscillospiraceae bacterium]